MPSPRTNTIMNLKRGNHLRDGKAGGSPEGKNLKQGIGAGATEGAGHCLTSH